ncbi:MAG: hypothetical protein R3C03_15305 [Pirellulaceae bacterium]
MNAFATQEDFAIPFLKTVAYTGDMTVRHIPLEVPEQPVAFRVRNERLKPARAAVLALAKIPGVESLDIVVSVLETAEMPVADQVDEKTIDACLRAMGEIGIEDDNVREAFSRHESAFAETIKQAKKTWPQRKKATRIDEELLGGLHPSRIIDNCEKAKS